MKKKWIKYFLTSLLLILVLYITFHKIYNKESWNVVRETIKNIKCYYVFICLLLSFLYFLCQGIYMKIILGTLNTKISVIKGIFYTVIEFFFSGITPSSTGGQPVQLYYMTVDKIPMRKSYITLILNTVFFKLILAILGILVLVFNNSFIMNTHYVYKVFFVIGFLVDLFIITMGCLLLFNFNLIKSMYKAVYNFCKKLKLFKNKLDNKEPDEVLNRYKDEIKYIKTHKLAVFVTFIITFIQRLFLFSIIYIVYRALGLNNYSYFDLLAIQVCVQLAMEAMPLPGGSGLSEGMLHNIFTMIFVAGLADVGMLLTRTFTFYIPLTISGIILLIDYIFRLKRKNKLVN